MFASSYKTKFSIKKKLQCFHYLETSNLTPAVLKDPSTSASINLKRCTVTQKCTSMCMCTPAFSMFTDLFLDYLLLYIQTEVAVATKSLFCFWQNNHCPRHSALHLYSIPHEVQHGNVHPKLGVPLTTNVLYTFREGGLNAYFRAKYRNNNKIWHYIPPVHLSELKKNQWLYVHLFHHH